MGLTFLYKVILPRDICLAYEPGRLKNFVELEGWCYVHKAGGQSEKGNAKNATGWPSFSQLI